MRCWQSASRSRVPGRKKDTIARVFWRPICFFPPCCVRFESAPRKHHASPLSPVLGAHTASCRHAVV